MRRIKAIKNGLIDVMFLERDSYSLHLFSIAIVKMIKGKNRLIKTPDIKIPMPTKPISIKLPKALKEAYDILRRKQED